MKAYAEALESRNASDTTANLERAIAADPNFGPAYRMLAESDAQRGDRAGGIAVWTGRSLAAMRLRQWSAH